MNKTVNENDLLIMEIKFWCVSAFVAIISICKYAVDYASGMYDRVWWLTPDGIGTSMLLEIFGAVILVTWLESHSKSKD